MSIRTIKVKDWHRSEGYIFHRFNLYDFAKCGGKFCTGSLETNLWHFISLQTGKPCRDIKPSCSDECLGNIFMNSVPGKKATSLLCQFTSYSLVQSLAQRSLVAYSWHWDLCISFSWQYIIICHSSVLNARILFSLVYHKKFIEKQLCQSHCGGKAYTLFFPYASSQLCGGQYKPLCLRVMFIRGQILLV